MATSYAELGERHHQLAVAMTSATLVVGGLVELPFAWQLGIAVVLIAILGVPHGGLDHLVGQSVIRPRHRADVRWWSGFVAVYLALAGSVVGAWWLVPGLTVGVLLALSIWHFGDGDRAAAPSGTRARGIEVFVRGAIPVALPAVSHQDQVRSLLAALMPAGDPTAASSILTVMTVAGWVALALAAVLAVAVIRAGRRPVALELGILTTLALGLPPLLSFTVYFCFWHAARHALWIAARLNPADPVRGLPIYARQSLPLAAAAIAGMGCVWWAATGAELAASDAAVRVLFVGLFALTVPHAILVDVARRGIGVTRTSTATEWTPSSAA